VKDGDQKQAEVKAWGNQLISKYAELLLSTGTGAAGTGVQGARKCHPTHCTRVQSPSQMVDFEGLLLAQYLGKNGARETRGWHID
jgi:hypothetical protein